MGRACSARRREITESPCPRATASRIESALWQTHLARTWMPRCSSSAPNCSRVPLPGSRSTKGSPSRSAMVIRVRLQNGCPLAQISTSSSRSTGRERRSGSVTSPSTSPKSSSLERIFSSITRVLSTSTSTVSDGFSASNRATSAGSTQLPTVMVAPTRRVPVPGGIVQVPFHLLK